MTQRIRILAHRGGPQRAPANTLRAFEQAMQDGADGFECDVALTRDREPVVIHKSFYSDSISRLIDQKGRLKELDWKELRNRRTNGEMIPHLHDALGFVSKHQMECFIEPKEVSEELVEKITSAISQYSVVEKVTLITFFHRRALLQISKKLNPTIKTSVILVCPFGSWSRKAEAASADMVVPGWKGFAGWESFNHLRTLGSTVVDLKRKIRRAHSRGMPVYSGIADNESQINWLCTLGVDGLFTDNIPLARRIVSSYGS
jgi:glycerophosphoryl diester phosphodiesterase